MTIVKTEGWYGPESYNGIGLSEVIAMIEGSFLLIFTFTKVMVAKLLMQKVKVVVRSFAQVSTNVGGVTSVRNCIYVIPEVTPLNGQSPKIRLINSLICLRVLAMYIPMVLICSTPLLMMLQGEFVISMMALAVFFFMKNAIIPSEEVKKYYSYLLTGNSALIC